MSLQGLVRRRHKQKGSLALVYNQKSLAAGIEYPPELKTVMGHFRYGFHQQLKRPARYYTFLRNPVDHVISHYFYSLEKPEKFPNLPKGILNVVDFALCNYGYNLQTRFVSGIDDIHGREKEALEMAKNNLKYHFEMIGITEDFDRSLLMLGRSLQWRLIYYKRENEGRKKKSSTAISKEEKEQLAEILKPDIELYKYGLHLFNNQIVKHPFLKQKLVFFKLGNGIFRILNPTYIVVKKILGLSVADLHTTIEEPQ